jgi:hypothetical protein
MNVCESGVQVTECARKTRVETMRGSWAGTPGPSSPSSVSSASCVCLSEREKEREREREGEGVTHVMLDSFPPSKSGTLESI